MSKRKIICFITASPETTHAQRLSQGIFAQCEKYGYNAAQFSTMITLDYYSEMKDYAQGEINLFDLINFFGI